MDQLLARRHAERRDAVMTATIAAVLLRRAPRAGRGLDDRLRGVVAVMWPALRDGSSSSITGVLLCLLALLCYGFAANVSAAATAVRHVAGDLPRPVARCS
jgi:drug/metabolite transporter (DMT)-like permease